MIGYILSMATAFKFPVILSCDNKSKTEDKFLKTVETCQHKEMLLFQAISIFLFFFKINSRGLR